MHGEMPRGRAKIGLVFLGRKRPGFDMDWGRVMERRARDMVRQTGFDVFEPEEKAVDEASLRSVLATCGREGVEVLVLLQTTMADGRLAPTVAQLWPDPPVFWATPENPDGDMISSCSLVGAHVWASTLRHMGHPFEIVRGDPEEAELRGKLSEAVRLCATIRRLREARVGIIGGQAPGFFAMGADPFSIHRGLGVQLQTFSLLGFANTVSELDEEEVKKDVAEVERMGFEHKDTSQTDLPMASRLYLAMRHYLDNENLDALSLRCWPEIPTTLGQWPYLGMARLADEGRAIACEGDAYGALCAWIGENLGMGRCYLSDWLEHNHERVTLWHGGAAPMSLSPAPGHPGAPRFARHFNNQKPMVCEATIAPDMPITVFRLWRYNGTDHLTACHGRTIQPERALMGTNARAFLVDRDPDEWFVDMCHAGMPHHVAVFRGHHRELLRRFARAMDVQWVA
ncbi:MAG: sugar isomerase [Planctomycetota bacterium]